MSILPQRLIPADVRQVIDRTDNKLDAMITQLAIVGDLIAEQNTLLREQNRMLRGGGR